MNILDETVVWEWCRDHHVPLSGDDPGANTYIQLEHDADAPHRACIEYARRHRSAPESTIARTAIAAIGTWDECLVWITRWGVWPSREDWPRFYAWRGAHDERRSLEVAPGHLFAVTDRGDLEILLTQILEYAWDATLLPSCAGQRPDRRLVVSHDEWMELQSDEPVVFALAVTPGT